MHKFLGELADTWTDEEVYAEFRRELARTINYESGLTEDLPESKEEAKKKESMPLRFLRRTRHWTDGLIIGKKDFVQEAAYRFYDRDRVQKKQFSRGSDRTGQVLHCYRRLRSLNTEHE